MAEIQGTCNEGFGAVRDALAASLDKDDVGASAAVYVNGEPVVDLWGGYLDAARTKPWQRDTITNVWSTSKTMTSLCALVLADRSELDLAAPVAHYWPQFAAAGKENVQVRHVLAHTAGLPDWDGPTNVEDLYDAPALITRLAAQSPQWEPGTAAGYHSLTQGFILDEVIRRITGRRLSAFFAEEIAGPLNADFHLGLPSEHDNRVAPVLPPPTTDQDGSEREMLVTIEDGNTIAWRRAQIPSAAGFGNARSVGLIQSVLGNGGVANGVRLLSENGCRRALEEQFHGEDRILHRTMRYGMGYGLFSRTCFWGGRGGSLVMTDFDTHMTVAYVMNQMLDRGTEDERGMSLMMAAYDGLPQQITT